jgi:hypothetical protein
MPLMESRQLILAGFSISLRSFLECGARLTLASNAS